VFVREHIFRTTRRIFAAYFVNVAYARGSMLLCWRCDTLRTSGFMDDATRYLGPLTRVDDLPGRRTPRSTNANRLVVPPVTLSTVGSRAFAVAAPHIWNSLPTDVVEATLLSTFRRLLKRFLFKQSHPDIIY